MTQHRVRPQTRSAISTFAGVFLIVFAVCAGAARAEDPIPQTVDAAHALASAGVAAAKAKDVATAEQKMRLVLASPVFARLEAKDQHDAWSIIGWADLQNDKPDEAIAMFRLACGSKFGNPFDWIKRAQAAESLHYDAESVGSLTLVAQKAPASLTLLRSYVIYDTADRSAALSDAAVIAFVGALHAAHWQAENRYEAPDRIWLLLARAYLDQGNVKAAADAMTEVTHTASLIAARSEKLFDPVVAMNPDKYDIAKATARNIAQYRQWAQEDGNKLEAVQFLANALIYADQPDEALVLMDAAQNRIKAADSGVPPYTDMKDELNWLLDARATALWDVGRTQESLAAMAGGAQQLEDGQQNASQRLNLAQYYGLAGKPREALDAVATLSLDHVSPYGGMVLASVRACAYAQLNDADNLRQQMIYVHAHSDAAPGIAFETFICAGDLDSAAAAITEQIQDPKTRSSMLVKLQNYATARGATPIEREYETRLIEVRDRPDVRKAIDALGHIGTYPTLEESVL